MRAKNIFRGLLQFDENGLETDASRSTRLGGNLRRATPEDWGSWKIVATTPEEMAAWQSEHLKRLGYFTNERA